MLSQPLSTLQLEICSIFTAHKSRSGEKFLKKEEYGFEAGAQSWGRVSMNLSADPSKAPQIPCS